MDIILVNPEIPHNSGCAGRLAAALNLRLHLVEPLGFSLEDRYLKRAGLDYWPMVDLTVHPDWPTLQGRLASESPRPFADRLRLFSARGGRSLFDTPFEADDLLIFGSETKGLPKDLLAAHPDARVYIPIQAGVRSLNLANTIALASYTALVRAGVPLPDNDGSHVPHPDADTKPTPRDRAR